MIPSRLAIATAILVAGVLWAPLPAASVTVLGELVVRLLALAALIVAVGSWPTLRRSRSVLVASAAILLLALLGLAQAQAWPSPLARLVSPEHFRLAAQAAAAVEVVEVGTTVEVDRVFLSLAPGKSRSTALSLLCTIGAFVAAFCAARRRRLRRWLALSVVAAGLVQLLVGARPFASGSVPRLRGTFVNPDHLATLLEISLSVCLAWAALELHRGTRRLPVVPLEMRLVHLATPVLAWLFLFVGLSFTGSRAGLVAATAAAVVQTALVSKAVARTSGKRRGSRLRRLRDLRVLAVLALGATAAVWVGFQAGFGRILATSRYEFLAAERFRVWDASLELARRFAFLGSGLGSFRETFEQIQPADLTLVWTRAHNDYVELLLTTGFLGLALAAVALAALAHGLWRGVGAATRTEDRLAAVAGWGVLVSLGVHEAFDFGATLPAISFVAAVALGAALSPPEPAEPQAPAGPKAVGAAPFRPGRDGERRVSERGAHRRS